VVFFKVAPVRSIAAVASAAAPTPFELRSARVTADPTTGGIARRIYAEQAFDRFISCLGDRGEMIADFVGRRR
jgi:hypothetical protein